MATYTIGRSKKNTVKITPLEKRGVIVVLTEDGGQYRQLCADPAEAVEYLGRMWGFGAIVEMYHAEMTAKVRHKLKLIEGFDYFA